jgi:hypothetical protein
MSKRILWWIGALVFGGVVILINSNSAQWVFLARAQWSALLALTILPVLAHTFGRELLIGGYDLNIGSLFLFRSFFGYPSRHFTRKPIISIASITRFQRRETST